MKLLKFAAVGLLLLLIAMVTSFNIYRLWKSKQPASSVGSELPPSVYSGSSAVSNFGNEETWMVQQIAQFIADFGRVAESSKSLEEVKVQTVASTGTVSRYGVKENGRETEFGLEAGVWNPKTYLSWAQRVLPAEADQAELPVSDIECARQLLNPGWEVFSGQNKRLSSFLLEHPASAQAHLQAALLVGTIALNEHAGKFTDTRMALNRMTAHLSTAYALGLGEKESGALLAEAIRLTLTGQQRDALALIALWPAELHGELGDWIVILKLRNTLDYRDLKSKALDGSPALRLEYFRALAYAASPSAALSFLQELKDKNMAAYSRVANECYLTVSQGHLFSSPMLQQELQEISLAASSFGVQPDKKGFGWLAEYLETPEGSPVIRDGAGGLALEVAGRNLFAGLQQRRLMHGLSEMYHFLEDMWGVQEQAERLKLFITDTLPPLRYKPFLLRRMASEKPERERANVPCAMIIAQHPEMVTASLWASLNKDYGRNDLNLSYPDFHSWFSPEVPAGTAFEGRTRMYDIGVGDENNQAWLKELWERAPYEYTIGMQNVWIENEHSWQNINPDLLVKWLGPLSEYHYRALIKMAAAYKGQPELYENAMKKLSDLNPDYYRDIAYYFIGRKMDEKAAEYFGLAYEKATDRVATANDALWYTPYLWEHGEKAKALEVASQAAEVYSYSGLESYVWVMEKEGKWPQALETCAKIDERYNEGEKTEQGNCLFRLYLSNPQKALSLGYGKTIPTPFKGPPLKVGGKDFKGPPLAGVLLAEYSKKMEPFALRQGMVIVALNGYRTDNVAQYTAIRGLSRDPVMRFIVWDGKEYRSSEGELQGRRFDVDIKDYEP